MLKPLRDLRETAGAISQGQLDRRVRVRSNDEVGALSVSFNQMADQIECQMEELAQVFQVDVADIIRGEEAGRAEHTVNELVKDTIDIAKREKKRQIRKYRWVLCILFVLFGVLIGYSVENIQKNYILEYHLCMNAVVESKGEVIYVRETDANGKNPGKVYRLAQDEAIPVTLPDGSAGSFKDIEEGQHIEIWYLGHRVLWKNAWIPGVEEVEITKEVKKDV